MERKDRLVPGPEQILWVEPFKFHWRRIPVFPRFWRGATKRLLALMCIYLVATYAIGFAFVGVEMFLDPVFSHPFLYVFGAVSMLWAGTITSFFIGISAVWVVQLLAPAKVVLLGSDIVLEKPRVRLPVSGITEARVLGSPTGPRRFEIRTADAHRSVGIPRGADLSELRLLLGNRLVFDDDGLKRPS